MRLKIFIVRIHLGAGSKPAPFFGFARLTFFDIIGYMKHDYPIHHRQSIRLRDYDYSQEGYYFVTICTYNKECLFGTIKNGEMQLNKLGEIVKNEWIKTFQIRPNVELDEFVVMPNHFHGIIIIDDCRGTARRAPTIESFGKPVPGSIPTVVRSFKSAVTKQINIFRNSPQAPVWQRNYYEHIIRNEISLDKVWEYIAANPVMWDSDEENPANL